MTDTRVSLLTVERISRHATIENEVLAEGSFKLVYAGTYVGGPRADQRCVCKVFKTGCVYEKGYFANELRVVRKTVDLVNKFNADRIINKSIWVNIPTIWEFSEGSRWEHAKNLVEPMISNFEKFNSNTGWTPRKSSPWIDVMQALSHYTYDITNGNLLVCDLQGGIYRDGFIITDPVIMSINQAFGPTDLGSKGISTFLRVIRATATANLTG